MGQVLGIVYRVIAGDLIKPVGFTRQRARTGIVTLIQRFGSALNLHCHTLSRVVPCQPPRGTHARGRPTAASSSSVGLYQGHGCVGVASLLNQGVDGLGNALAGGQRESRSGGGWPRIPLVSAPADHLFDAAQRSPGRWVVGRRCPAASGLRFWAAGPGFRQSARSERLGRCSGAESRSVCDPAWLGGVVRRGFRSRRSATIWVRDGGRRRVPVLERVPATARPRNALLEPVPLVGVFAQRCRRVRSVLV
jgi:hypothetical protein